MGTTPKAWRAAASAAWLVVAGAAYAAGGCEGASWPRCENDDWCNEDGHHGVCLNGKCAECRDDAACGTGRMCASGTCTAIAGYCDETHACNGGQECQQNRCQAAAKFTQLEKPFVECDDTKPCASGARCENGHCVSPPQGGPGCTDFPAPHFDYESPDLRGESRAVLERLAQCLTKGTLQRGRLLLTGHCDPRGEQEFNMSLGENRAEAVKVFLIGLGVPAERIRTSSRGELDSTGNDEAGWANDRRVDIEVR
jgi:peptidoglycan-associated lipoprotein